MIISFFISILILWRGLKNSSIYQKRKEFANVWVMKNGRIFLVRTFFKLWSSTILRASDSHSIYWVRFLNKSQSIKMEKLCAVFVFLSSKKASDSVSSSVLELLHALFSISRCVQIRSIPLLVLSTWKCEPSSAISN